MIQRAITAIIGVVIGLFATFAVFSAILGGLDSFYLLTQDACNYGSINSPKRVLRVAPENPEHPGDADEIDWTADGLDLVHDGSGGCEVPGAFEDDLTYLSPTGDLVQLGGGPAGGALTQTDRYELLPAESLSTAPTHLAFSDEVLIHPSSSSSTSDTAYVLILNTNTVDFSFPLDSTYNYGAGAGVGVEGGFTDVVYALPFNDDAVHVYDFFSKTIDRKIPLPTGGNYSGLHDHFDHLYTFESNNNVLYRIDVTDDSHQSWRVGSHIQSSLVGLGVDSVTDALAIFDDSTLHIAPDFRDASTDYVSLAVETDPAAELYTDIAYNRLHSTGGGQRVALLTLGVTGDKVYSYEFDVQFPISGGGLPWIEAEDVFTAQEQLVTLLAVIAAIGMPIGAMTAIVFFGQAVISSGISGQGASQVMVAIAAVVVILVSIQMFQQFAGFLGNAFDAVNGDRFVVFDETLGSLAETIAEFWGVLAFAGFINIASIVWRNYSGNFSIGGTQGGL